jgi:DNA primase
MESIYGQKAVVELMLPYLQNIFNPIIFDHYLKLLSTITNVSIDTIKKSIFNLKRGKNKKYENKTKTTPKQRKNVEEGLETYLLALFVQTNKAKKLLDLVEKELEQPDFHSPATYKLFEHAQKIVTEDSKELLEKLEQQLPKELLESYNKGFLYELPSGDINWNKEIKKTILKIKKHSLKKQISDLMKTDDENSLKDKLKKLSEVEKTLAIV